MLQQPTMGVDGYFRYSSCSNGNPSDPKSSASVTYSEFAKTDATCGQSPTLTKIIKGGCVATENPNTPDLSYIRPVSCMLDKDVSSDQLTANLPLPVTATQLTGMVVEYQLDTLASQNLVGFSASSVLSCNLRDPTDSWDAIYGLSSALACDDQNKPQLVGYLGTHCSKKSNVLSLPVKPTLSPPWQSSLSYTAHVFTCTPPKVDQEPSGWVTQTYYDKDSCSGSVLSVTGQATGFCARGYNNVSVAMGSQMYTCDGLYLYDTLDCTGPSNKVTSYTAGQCIPNPNNFGLRGNYGAAFKVDCVSGSFPEIPHPFGSQVITMNQYDNNVCAGISSAFAAYPQDSPYTNPQGNSTTVVSCETGLPVLTRTQGETKNPMFTTFSQFLDTTCDYLDPAYTSDFTRGSDLMYYSSQIYSMCERSCAPPPPPTLAFPDAKNAPAYAGAVSGIFFGLCIFFCAIGGIYYYCTRIRPKLIAADQQSLVSKEGRSNDGGDEIPGPGHGGIQVVPSALRRL